MRKAIFLVTLLWMICCNTQAQEKPTAFTGALIYPVTGAPIQNGVLIVQNGKILSVGGADSKIPADAIVTDVKGKVIMPGVVDTHSHLGRSRRRR